MQTRTSNLTATPLVCLLCLTALSCGREVPTGPGRLTERNPAPRGSKLGPEFVVYDLGVLPGADWSASTAANDDGLVVGVSDADRRGGRAFLWTGTGMVALPDAGDGSAALAISNGPDPYVGGSVVKDGSSRAALWTVKLEGAPSVTHRLLESTSNALSMVRGVNDRGDGVGAVGRLAVIWKSDGSRVVIDPPGGFPSAAGGARDINNEGLVVVQFKDPEGETTRAFLRLGDATLVPLLPAPGDNSSFAGALTEIRPDGTVFVAGTTMRDATSFRAIRWHVDAQTGAVVDVLVTRENGSSASITEHGDLGGSVEKRQTSKPTLWQAGSATSLPLSRGLASGNVEGVSPSGTWSAGWGLSVPSRRALIWRKAR